MIDILVTDDNDDHLRLIAMILSGEGRRVWVARDATDALALMQRRPYALAIFDIRMPDMDGIELASRLRQTAGDVPLLFLTAGQLEPENLARIYGLASMREILPKPIDADVLEAVAEGLLGNGPISTPRAIMSRLAGGL